MRADQWEGVPVEFGVGFGAGAGDALRRLSPDPTATTMLSGRAAAAWLTALLRRIGRAKLREVTVGFADLATTVASRLKLTEQELKRTLREFNRRYPEFGLTGLEEGLAGSAPGNVEMLPMWRADP